jgi:hypothetical protein
MFSFELGQSEHITAEAQGNRPQAIAVTVYSELTVDDLGCNRMMVAPLVPKFRFPVEQDLLFEILGKRQTPSQDHSSNSVYC